ncbi:hypothetical protein [Hymenobacter latericus]|uniref:hypothetical protein n=1 Tax=Hymenobacter sp. YIM 151858-1 TaxID=2987688 RepID=UPI002226D1B3|nr:hypothetical protein [Hymenobacter sp. YIM 151858-1]UYZ61223.1 hypothetical protein OIS50_19835 [Hymenobacter sp. YIM 151858-1]
MDIAELEALLAPGHPYADKHRAQLQALAQLQAEQREYMARLFRFGNATFRYQQLAAGEVTEADYLDWLEGLPERFRAIMERDGFEKCKTSLPLRRHALERRDVGFGAFLQSVLSAEDWASWQAEKAGLSPLPGSELS